MQLAQVLGRFLPLPRLSLDGARNALRDAWDLLAGLPGGRVLFSRIVGRVAPYTGSIGATVAELRPGFAQVVMPDRRGVRNHLHSVHAAALANLAECAANLALAYSLPDDARFIVTGLEIEYTKKARGPITALAECAVPGSAARAEYPISITLRDDTGEEVARVVVRSLVGPKPGRDRTHLN
jgi:acyl-coenzyme A thioesterase PaaI-like protein